MNLVRYAGSLAGPIIVKYSFSRSSCKYYIAQVSYCNFLDFNSITPSLLLSFQSLVPLLIIYTLVILSSILAKKIMEGLIPFLYRAIVQYRNGGDIGTFLNESPSASYMRLPGDSGRFQVIIESNDGGFSPCSSPSTAATKQPVVGVQKPGIHGPVVM